MSLNTEPNLKDPDAFYERLIELHAGLTDQQSIWLNDRLAALLAARAADAAALREAASIADEGIAGAARTPMHVAKFILLLANHIGESPLLEQVLSEAARMAAELASTAASGNVPR